MLKNLIFILFLFISSINNAQVAADSVNKTDAEGKRQGKWIITNKIAQKVGFADNQKVDKEFI